MQSSKLPPKNLLSIAKEFLSIDFEALNLIQLALFAMPTHNIVTRLKKLLGIKYLTHQEIIQEFHYPHSPLRKYLYAIMSSYLIQCEILLDENFQRILLTLLKKGKRRFIVAPRGSGGRSRRRQNIFAIKAKLMTLEPYAVVALHKVEPSVLPSIKVYALEGHRRDLLLFYLKYADAKLAPVVVDMVDAHINLLILGYQRYEEIIQRQDITPLQRQRADEWLERRVNRIQALTPENIQMILPHLPLYDPVSLRQHLVNTLLKNNYIENRKLLKIGNKEELIEEQTPSSQASSEQQKTNDSILTQLTLPEHKQLLQYKMFQDSLNDLFTNIFDKHGGILVYEVRPILAFLHMLMKIVQKKNTSPSYLAKVKLAAFELVETLSKVEEVDYTPLIECIYKMYGEDFALMQRYIATVLPAKESSGVSDMPTMKETIAEDEQSLKVETNEKVQDLTQLQEEVIDESHEMLSSQGKLSLETKDSITNPVRELVIELLKHEPTKELQINLVDILELLKKPFTQEVADKIIDAYNQAKTHFPTFDSPKLLLEELSKLPFIVRDSLEIKREDDFGF